MAEQKAAVEVKQEGDFKIKSKPKRKTKDLTKNNDEPVKVDLTKPEAQGEVIPEVVKVDLTDKKEEDAVQESKTETIPDDKPSGDLPEAEEEVRVINTDETEEPAIERVEETVEQQPVKQVEQEIKVPENLNKLVDFYE